MKQRKYGFENKKSISYTAYTTMVANYLRRNEEKLAVFRKHAE